LNISAMPFGPSPSTFSRVEGFHLDGVN